MTQTPYTPRGEALAQIASGYRQVAEGLERLAALDEPERAVRQPPALLSVEQAMELWPGIGPKQLLDATRGRPFVRKPTPKKVLFERAAYVRWLTVRGVATAREAG